MVTNIADDLMAKAGENYKYLRLLCCAKYRMYVLLKDGRQRFQFSDSSYIDFYIG